MQQHGEIKFAKQALVDVIHLRVTGEQHECPATRNCEQAPDAVGSLGGKLRGARIGQIGWDIKQRLIFVIEMRGQNGFAGVLKAQAIPHVLETAAYGERG